MTKKNSSFFLLILLSGIVLRFWSAINKVFWFDEALAWQLSIQNLSSVLSVSAADNNPPFYYLLLHFWQIWGSSELFLRLPSFIFGLFSIFIGYKVACEFFSKKVALLYTILLSLSPLWIYYSMETRAYSLWIMLIILSFYFFIKILKTSYFKDYLLFTLCCLFSLYTHYYTLFFLLSLNLFLILKRQKYSKLLVPFFITQAISFLAFLPWLIIFLTNSHPLPWSSSLILGIPATFFGVALGGLGMVTLKTFFATTTPFLFKFLFAGLSFFLGYLFLMGLLQKDKQEVKLLLLLIIFFPILLAVLTSLITPVYSPRAFIAFSFAFYLLAVRGLEKLSGNIKSALFLLITLLVTVILIQNLYPPFKPQTIRMAAQFIRENSNGKPLIIHTDLLTFYPFLYYFKDNRAYQSLVYDSGLPKKTTEILGGSSTDFSETIKPVNSFWSVTFSWDEKTTKFKEEQTKLNKKFNYRLVKQFNDLEIFYYQPALIP